MNTVVGYREGAMSPSPCGGDRPGSALTTAAPTAVKLGGNHHRAPITVISSNAKKSADEMRKRARTQQILRLMLLASAKNKKQAKRPPPVRMLVLQKLFCDSLTQGYYQLQRTDAIHPLF